MDSRIKVGKSTDGLVGKNPNKKPRYYAVIDEDENENIVISKITTHDPNNPNHVRKEKFGLRKPVKRFSSDSYIDATLYIETREKKPIKKNYLNYKATNNFVFNKSESKTIRRFVFSKEKNRDRYKKFKKK